MPVSFIRSKGLLGASSLVLLLLAAAPAQAHHLLDITGLEPNAFNGLLSGLAHPVLGPDHLVFLLALALMGLRQRRTWVITLLGFGLLGSAMGLVLPGLPGAELLVSLSLVLEALVLLQRAPAALLVPAIALHGYVLSDTVLGWSAMPIGTYLLGLLLSQGLLITVALTGLRGAAGMLTDRAKRLLAVLLITLGSVWALAQAGA